MSHLHLDKLYDNPALMDIELPIKAASGSKLAKSLMLVVQYSKTINKILEKGERMTAEDTSNVVNLLYECCTMERDAVKIDNDKEALLLQILERLFATHEATSGIEDMKVRLCYVYFCLVSFHLEGGLDRPDIEIIKEGKQRYPNNYHYPVLLFDLYFKCREFDMAMITVDEALTKFTSNSKLLFNLAKLQVPNYQDHQGALEVFDNYLINTLTEEDDRHRPEAYFLKAHWYFCFQQGPVKLLRVNEFYELGCSAEKKQLSCFLPSFKSRRREEVENYLTINNITLSS